MQRIAPRSYRRLLVPALALLGCSSPTGSPSTSPSPSEDVQQANDVPPSEPTTPATPSQPGHHRCGWMFTNDPAINADFTEHAAFFEAIHPVWYALQSDGVNLRAIAGNNDPGIVSTCKSAGIALIPTVASVDDANFTRTMLYSPANRAAHIKALVNLAVSKGYAGLDLDYEHLWNAADGAPLAAFVKEVSAAMHAAGKTINMAVTALPNDSTVWDYELMAANLDAVHLMGYDYHTIGTHAGPTAPLGWIDAVNAHAERTGHPEKFMLGLPNYGVTTSSMCALSRCAAKCTSAVSTSTTHMLSCSLGTYTTPDRILNCNSAEGMLYFDDTASLEQKVQSAAARGLGGITYWQLGGEPPGFFEMIQRYY